MRRQFYVYAYFDLTGVPCYIGKGSGDRWVSHQVGSSNTHLASMINKYGQLPVVIIRDGLTETEAYELEEMLTRIVGLRSLGTGPLVNFGFGGRGGPAGIIHSKDRRKLRSERATALWQDPEYRTRMTRPDRGRSGNTHPRSDEFKAALSSRMEGNQQTLGLRHSEHSFDKMRRIQRKLVWINNGQRNSKIDCGASIPEGWARGRLIHEGHRLFGRSK